MKKSRYGNLLRRAGFFRRYDPGELIKFLLNRWNLPIIYCTLYDSYTMLAGRDVI